MHGFTRGLKWPLMKTITCSRIVTKFLKPISCGVSPKVVIYLEVSNFIRSRELCAICQTPHGLEGAYHLDTYKHCYHLKCFFQLSVTHNTSCICHISFHTCWYEKIGWQKWMPSNSQTTISWATSGP